MSLPPTAAKSPNRGQKRTDLLVSVLVTLLGASVLLVAIEAAMIRNRNETIRSLQTKIAGDTSVAHPLVFYASHGGTLPIVATSRRSLSGTGFILTVRNKSTEELPVTVSLSNAASTRHKQASIVLEPQQTAEFGHFDEWRLATGDVVELSHEGFGAVTMRIP